MVPLRTRLADAVRENRNIRMEQLGILECENKRTRSIVGIMPVFYMIGIQKNSIN